jgi:dTDP-4-dehydrorhamnose reductase
MKLLITGANGLLGQHLVKMLIESTDYKITATGKGVSRLPVDSSNRYNYVSLDITDGVEVNTFIAQNDPDIIIHTAAITQVDDCEKDPGHCWNTNVTATRFLVGAAEMIDAKFIYISTDFIFDGEAGPYIESDIPSPVNYYGSSKLGAEKSVIEAKLSWCIIRTVLVYGNILVGNRNNMVSWVQNNLSQGKSIQVVSDQLRTPTYVEDLAKGILLVIQKKAIGIYHISGDELMSPYEMALATAEYLHLDKNLIEKVDAAIFKQAGKRPAKTGFVIDKAKNELGFKPLTFKEGLKKML